MKKRLNPLIIGTLILSILLYSVPFAWGGYVLRGILIFFLLILGALAIRNIRRFFPNATQIKAVLLMLNSLAIFHFLLIFVYLVMEPAAVWLLGVLMAGLIYYLIHRKIETYRE